VARRRRAGATSAQDARGGTHDPHSREIPLSAPPPSQHYKVAVLGAAGGIGQPLSLLLKDNENITHLSLYDLHNTPGVAADISHIPTKAKVRVVFLSLSLSSSSSPRAPPGAVRPPSRSEPGGPN
jgi:hypothetical protein